ncbi:hypothetical protein HUU05_26095 [candidate division KSB1 bacterium]|nr:hypothetical protein [candidate division KSB1 bacterium]
MINDISTQSLPLNNVKILGSALVSSVWSHTIRLFAKEPSEESGVRIAMLLALRNEWLWKV